MLVCSFRAARQDKIIISSLLISREISRDSHLPIQLLDLEMECTETSLERRGNEMEYKEALVKRVGDTSIKTKTRKVSR